MKNTKIKYKLNFKTMKKGLLTLLAASLVFVGCQNYDDQFDDLNAQISALKSQVDGLSALSGQVSALSGSISGLQSGIAASASSAQMTALSASLTALQAEVDAIEAAIATTATAAEVTALQTSLTALEADLDDLLVSNNVYSTNTTINSAATMAAALALGNKVALMNGTLDITDNAAVSDTDLQTFINRIKTMNNTFTYSSGSTTGFAPTFDEMTSAKDMTLTMAGDISFKKLTAAGTIEIHDDYETKITSVDFGAATSITGLTTDEAGTDATNTVRLNSATNLDLGSLARYGSSLTIQIKKGGTLDIASLDDINAAGTAVEAVTLTITGPDSVTLSKIDDGTITLTDVNTVNVSNFYGTLDIKTGVKTLTTTKSVFVDLDTATNLETATLNMVNDYDPALTTANAALSAAGNSSTYTGTLSGIAAAALKTLTITGNFLDLTLDTGENNLETLSIDATFDDLSIDGLTDLTSLTVSAASKMGDVTLTNTTNLAVADFDHSFIGTTTGTTAATSSVVSITDNSALTTLHYAADDVGTLTVTGNDALSAIDFTGLGDDGGDTTPAANVYDNNLTATKATDSSDGDTDASSGAAGDLGTFDSGTSGMATLKTYLTHVVADSDFAGYVAFDTVSTNDNTETAGTTTTTLNKTYTNATTWFEGTVLYEVAQVSANGGSPTKAKRAYLLDYSAVTNFQLYANGNAILDVAGDNAPVASAELVKGLNSADQVAATINASASRATAAGVTMNASVTGNSSIAIHIGSTASSASWETTSAVASAVDLTAAESTTLTVGNLVSEVAMTDANAGASTAYAVASRVATIIRNAANTLTGGASAAYYNVTVSGNVGSSALVTNGAMFWLKADDVGSGGNGLAASLTTEAATGRSAIDFVPYAIGQSALTTDNTTTAIEGDIVITFESNTAGVAGTVIGLPATSAASGTFSAATMSHAGTGIAAFSELHSNLLANAGTNKATGSDQHADESRSDVRYPEDTVAATITTAAVAKSRLGWL